MFQQSGREFVDFLNASVTPFHVVEEVKKLLEAAGFTHISEKQSWDTLKLGGKYFFTRNLSTLVAFAVGGRYTPGNGFKLVGAHTDSPCLKAKPVSSLKKEGFLEVDVELYGGGLWYTWFDRDLTLAGRVIIRTAGGRFDTRLVHLKKPMLRIPSLAIHLDPEVNEAFKFNKQNHLQPVLCSAVKAELQAVSGSSVTPSANSAMEKKHHPVLLTALAKELNVDPLSIIDFELLLTDTQPSTIGGLFEEFVYSPRLDNLISTFCSTKALIASCEDDEQLQADTDTRAIVLFDHEEVGSDSSHGAGSPLLAELMSRLTQSQQSCPADAAEVALRKSFLISADASHGIHPNYPEKHESLHAPHLNKGPAIKTNVNQRYATNGLTGFIIRELAARNGIPIQEFSVRNDMRCGSTIGPICATRTGVRTVDIGNPMWSMHSIRETCGVEDITHCIKLMKVFFEQFREIDDSLSADQ